MSNEPTDKLFVYAVRVLAARAYSEAVLRRKMVKRGTSEEINTVIGRLKTAGYLNDTVYAEGYARLYTGKWGASKIKQGLLTKGVSSQTINTVLEKLAPETDPLEEALRLLERYQSRHKGDKAKAVRFLAGRGYRFGDALAAWEKYEREAGGGKL